MDAASHNRIAWQQQLNDRGFVILTGIFEQAEAADIAAQLEAALFQDQAGSTLRAAEGTIFAARNILELWPSARDVWRKPPLPQMLQNALGSEFGLVRALYFDKPPDRTWGLPWHKDLTIAVQENRLPSELFRKPTTKAGVPHVQAPVALLDNMLTLRIHLDDVTPENGPLQVIPGSHHGEGQAAPVSILVSRGDVLLMRPLLDHRSPCSQEGTTMHRRLLHLEFAGWPKLPDGYAWHDFVPGV